MDINSIIFESMLAEASAKVGKLVNKNVSIQEAVEQVSSDLELTTEERAALEERARKISKKVGDEPVGETADMVVDPNPEDCCTTDGNCIHFGSEDDLDQAAGMLMYKNVPWKSKSKDGGKFLIEFDDHATMQTAQAVLKRKYDFVESTSRRVGMVQFDNLADYSKVLEFMKRQNMMIETQDGVALDEDAEIQEALSLELGQDGSASRSFVARPRGLEGIAEMDVFENSAARSVVVRKRWK